MIERKASAVGPAWDIEATFGGPCASFDPVSPIISRSAQHHATGCRTLRFARARAINAQCSRDRPGHLPYRCRERFESRFSRNRVQRMSVRRRGRSWIVMVYDRERGFSRHVGTFPTHRRACEVETLAKAGTYEPPRPGCPRGLSPAPVVYFIEAPDLGLVKIGHSTDVTKRFSQLARSAPVELRLAYFIEGGLDLEAAIHRQLAHLRVRSVWFRIAGELEQFLRLRSSRCLGRVT